jgi:Transglycosylase-like domain
VDVRRIVLNAWSLQKQQPWHNRIRYSVAIIVFAIPNLLLSLALVPASEAVRTIPDEVTVSSLHHQKHTAIKAIPVHVVVPVVQTPVTAPPVTAPPVAPTPVTTPPPGAPVPAPTPAPALFVDSSSAAAWAASPGVACIREHESGDNYSTNTGNGYYGAYQDLLSTWESHGGTGLPSNASPAVQDQINYQIWLSGGWGQWSTARLCGL